VTYFLGTVSRFSLDNWDLAKIARLWGVSAARARTAKTVKEGDRLIIWGGGKGYVAECEVTGPSREPRNNAEAPWEGGTYHWALVVPFAIVREVQAPVWLPFEGQVQRQTLLSKNHFRSSFQKLSDEKARIISDLIKDRVDQEANA
jgi:EVE domain